MRHADTEEAQAGYDVWRARFPWPTEAFVAALLVIASEQRIPYWATHWTLAADRLQRTQRLSATIARMCVPYLVRRCVYCGKKALYRVGVRGYCSAHRAVAIARTNMVLRGKEGYRSAREKDLSAHERDVRSGDRLLAWRRQSDKRRTKDRRS